MRAHLTTGNRLLAALLLVALLLCHGAFGSLHQLHDTASATHHAHTTKGANGHHGEHPGSSDYFAALLSAFFGAALWLLLRGIRARASAVTRETLARTLATHVPCPLPRGPTAPFLQVFRL